MKKNFKFFALTALFAGLSMSAFAQEKATTVWRYTVSGSDATLIGFVADLSEAGKADVTIPNQVTDPANANVKYTVKFINEDAFSISNDKGKLKKLTIAAEKLTAIPAKLVQGCGNLTEIDLSNAKELATIPDAAFKGTKIESLDLSKTKVNAIGNLFGTNYEYIATSGTYTKAEANQKNVEWLKKNKKAYVEEGDPVLDTGKFNDYEEINAYYQAWYPEARKAGDKKPMDKADANTANKAKWTNCVAAGDNVIFTLETALAWNVKYVTGAMPEGYVLTEIEAQAYNKALGITTKKAGDKLTASEAQAYNETLTSVTYKSKDITSPIAPVAKVGDNAMDDKGQALLYDDDTAYAYNLANQPGCYVVGDESATVLSTHYEAWLWNNANVVPAGAQKDKGDWGDVPTGSYYTADGAYTKNVKNVEDAGGTATYEGDSKAGEKVAAVNNNTFKSLTLNSTWTGIAAGAFENCTALATINFGKAANGVGTQSVGDRAFLGAPVTELNLVGTHIPYFFSDTFVDYDKSYTDKSFNEDKANTSLTSVTFNKDFLYVHAGLFGNCTSLATVVFEDRDIQTESAPGKPVVFKQAFTGIGSDAFAYTAITEFTVPQALDPTTSNSVNKRAFIGCSKLKTFTYMVDNNWASVKPKTISQEAFPGCIKVAYVTTNANIAAFMEAGLDAPKNTYFVLADDGSYVTPFKPVQYKSNPNKYYIKYKSVGNIMVDKNEAKVYNAYVDYVDGSINMCLYQSVGGYYHIGNKDVVLIITSNPDLMYEKSTYGSSAMVSNDMDIVTPAEGIKRAQLDYMAGPNAVPFGWVNTTAGTGWQYIASGDVFPQGSLYIFGAPILDESRVKVNWLDENGNIEAQTTGIESIVNVEETTDGATYNLQGIRVNGAQKGMFIKNGKKFVK